MSVQLVHIYLFIFFFPPYFSFFHPSQIEIWSKEDLSINDLLLSCSWSRSHIYSPVFSNIHVAIGDDMMTQVEVKQGERRRKKKNKDNVR